MTDYSDIKKQIYDKIIEYNTIIITRHIRPDGDCIGSSLGLRDIIRCSFPDKHVYSVGRTAGKYLDFLGTEDSDVDPAIYAKALVIVVDTASSERIDDDNYHKAKCLIKIDHHISVDDYGHINYVREDLPAAALIIIDLYRSFSETLKMNETAAKALFTGIVTDTGRFKYSGVGGDTFILTSVLFGQTIDINDIYNRLYTKDKAEYKLRGYIFNKFKTTKNGVAYFVITKRILRRFRFAEEGVSASVNLLEGIKDHLIWMFFIENNDKSFRVRIRSRYVPINEMAETYGGGGHAQAAGALAANARQVRQIIEHADSLVEKYKKENPEVF